MAQFEYKALQGDGTLAVGQLDANGRQEAMRLLEARGLQPVRLVENGDAPAASNGAPKGFQVPWSRNRISFSMLEDFTRSLSSLLAAGVPLSRALTILFQEATAPAAANKWREIHGLVIDGVSLADAMARSPEAFPRVYTAMVQAGEAGGFLDVVLSQIADFQAREKELRAKVLAALIYPSVLLSLAVCVLIFLLVFFIPRFQTLFEGFDATLPALTRAIVAASHLVRGYGPFLAAALVVGIAFGRRWLASDRGRRTWETQLLHAPVLGPLMSRLAMSRFCRMLGTLLKAGVPLINALNVARRSIGYQTLVDAAHGSIERVRKGEGLGASLSDCRVLFPGSALEMIKVAEESGRLDEELIRLADVSEGALDRQLKTAVALTEPLMLFLIAGFIGVIFIGMVIPIFTIQDYIK
ncbi:MAG: type II secretion system F family protein [Verrucomicrobiales bacterium]|nr:type II secretion system F family protein [Verrucomicrobiales bacterium]MCP5528441.1 type II secretion system F family protein [Verrucomicrobiales bacterium]